jgi:hypothetical protein
MCIGRVAHYTSGPILPAILNDVFFDTPEKLIWRGLGRKAEILF